MLAPVQKRRPLQGVATALAAIASSLVRLTGKFFGGVRDRGGTALADFRARPEHSRWRAYALGGYGMILAGTLGAQLYNYNSLGAYVRVPPAALPPPTPTFVPHPPRQAWQTP